MGPWFAKVGEILWDVVQCTVQVALTPAHVLNHVVVEPATKFIVGG